MKPSPGNTARLASEAELLGLSLGPTALALLTDYVFKDPAMIDWSISCVVIASSLFSAIMLWRCLQPFTEAVQEQVN